MAAVCLDCGVLRLRVNVRMTIVVFWWGKRPSWRLRVYRNVVVVSLMVLDLWCWRVLDLRMNRQCCRLGLILRDDLLKVKG